MIDIYVLISVYMHDRILVQLLPYFNVTYIPLTMPSYDNFWIAPSAFDPKYSTLHAKDCIREPWPSFGKDGLENTFFGALWATLSLL